MHAPSPPRATDGEKCPKHKRRGGGAVHVALGEATAHPPPPIPAPLSSLHPTQPRAGGGRGGALPRRPDPGHPFSSSSQTRLLRRPMRVTRFVTCGQCSGECVGRQNGGRWGCRRCQERGAFTTSAKHFTWCYAPPSHPPRVLHRSSAYVLPSEHPCQRLLPSNVLRCAGLPFHHKHTRAHTHIGHSTYPAFVRRASSQSTPPTVGPHWVRPLRVLLPLQVTTATPPPPHTHPLFVFSSSSVF